MSTKSSVTVIGSLNIDYFSRVESLPAPGETVASDRLDVYFGGKGANQSISANRQGSQVYLFGVVGEDGYGEKYKNALTEEGIDTSFLLTGGGNSGSAFITVDRKGENMIVISSGSNQRLSVEDVRKGKKTISECGAVIGQFETPKAALLEAGKIANAANIPLIINPSPFDSTFPWHEIKTDYVIVNELEASELLEFELESEDVSTIRQRIHELRIENLIITRGGEDTLVYSRTEDPMSIPTMPVLPVDTVGAGDAFAGCFAARIACGESLELAIQAANCAGALTTLGAGAQNPIPDKERVDQHLQHLSTGT